MRADWKTPGSRLIVPLSEAASDHERTRWLQARGGGVGGSDIAALLGESPYDDATPWFVWKDKTDPMWRADEQKAVQTRGQKMEPLVIAEFLLDPSIPEGMTVRRAGLHQSRTNPILLANVDRLTSDGGGLEAKTTTSFTIRSWAAEFGVGEPPTHYVRQAQWYCLVTGRSHWWLAILVVDTWELLVWRIERDEDQFEYMETVASEFWRNHVELGIEPDPSDSMLELAQRYPQDDGSVVDLDPESDDAHRVAALIQERREIDAEMKPLKSRREAIDNQLRAIAAGNSEIQVGGKKAFSWKLSTSTKLDSKLLKEKEPDVWDRYSKTTSGRSLYVSASIFK